MNPHRGTLALPDHGYNAPMRVAQRLIVLIAAFVFVAAFVAWQAMSADYAAIHCDDYAAGASAQSTCHY